MEETILNNKKAGILDWFLIMTILFMTGICVFAAYIILDKTTSEAIFQDNEDAAKYASYSRLAILNMDNVMLWVIVGLSIFVLASSAMVFNHPAYFVVSLFLLFIAITVAAQLSNTFWTFSQNGIIATTAANFPKIQFIMEKLPFYVAFMGIAAAIVMYISSQQQ